MQKDFSSAAQSLTNPEIFFPRCIGDALVHIALLQEHTRSREEKQIIPLLSGFSFVALSAFPRLPNTYERLKTVGLVWKKKDKDDFQPIASFDPQGQVVNMGCAISAYLSLRWVSLSDRISDPDNPIRQSILHATQTPPHAAPRSGDPDPWKIYDLILDSPQNGHILDVVKGDIQQQLAELFSSCSGYVHEEIARTEQNMTPLVWRSTCGHDRNDKGCIWRPVCTPC